MALAFSPLAILPNNGRCACIYLTLELSNNVQLLARGWPKFCSEIHSRVFITESVDSVCRD